MAYESVDKLQRVLAEEVFNHTKDPKKASGRALGTLVEIITYYLLKTRCRCGHIKSNRRKNWC